MAGSKSGTPSSSSKNRRGSVKSGSKGNVSDSQHSSSSTNSQTPKSARKSSNIPKSKPVVKANRATCVKAFDDALKSQAEPKWLLRACGVGVVLPVVAYFAGIFPFLHKFIVPQYPQLGNKFAWGQTGELWRYHGVGIEDWYLVIYALMCITLIRSALRKYVLKPLGVRGGIATGQDALKFMEQAYSGIYFVCSFSIGVSIIRKSPFWFNTHELWSHYPMASNPAVMKVFYLVALAYWLHQSIIFGSETDRTDRIMFIVHHIVTCSLIIASYFGHQTRAGIVIMMLTDSGDIFLSLAKCLKYANFPDTLTDGIFGFFVLVWIYTRHFLFGFVAYSLAFESYKQIPYKWDPANNYYWNKSAHFFFAGFVFILQILFYIWLYLILRIVYRVIVRKEKADDIREKPKVQ